MLRGVSAEAVRAAEAPLLAAGEPLMLRAARSLADHVHEMLPASAGRDGGVARVLVLAGAGATGGAFGSYLVEAGRRVTFLLRPARAEAVRTEGLRFVAPDADRTNVVDVVTADELVTSPRTFDIVIIAVKAGGLD